MFTEIITIYSANQTQYRNRTPGRQVARWTKYCTMMTSICGNVKRNLLNVVLLVPRIKSLLLWLKKIMHSDTNCVFKKHNF
jgi:hypothetical protein